MRASYPDAPGLKDPITGKTQTFELHRNRIGIQGNLFKHIEFEIERELTEKELTEKDMLRGLTPQSQWKDVNVNVTFIKNAQIQVGKFKIPFGLDELTGVTHNDFVYRSLGASYLAPARDIGGMVHGPVLQARPELLGRRVHPRRRQRPLEEDPGRRRRRRRGSSAALLWKGRSPRP